MKYMPIAFGPNGNSSSHKMGLNFLSTGSILGVRGLFTYQMGLMQYKKPKRNHHFSHLHNAYVWAQHLLDDFGHSC